MKNYKILIIGGGIAGLSAMRALERRGFHPELVEQSDTIHSDGTGILLGFNAVATLYELGLKNEIEAYGLELSTMTAFDEEGKKIVACNLDYVKEKSGYTTYGIAREDLIDILVSSINKKYLKIGKRVQSIVNTEHGVNVIFDDGSTSFYDVVVGADGINSTVRKSLFGEIPLRDAKQACWRFMAKTPANFNQNGIFEYFGVGKRAGYMPMKNGELYAYILLNENKYDREHILNLDELLAMCQEFKGDWQLISPALTKASKVKFDMIKDLSQICITKGRVVLIGDAAHAITPNLGQGAAMGIEDAELLAYYLYFESNAHEALQAFAKRRVQRVQTIQTKSYMIGKIAQSSSPLFCKLRNSFYRLLPSRAIAEDTLKTLSRR